ncbi:MAG: response regulator [Chloroflexi bacterium]|nr:response regulator [Chloroflexota bacterium]
MAGQETTLQLPLVLIVEDDENLLGGIIDILTMDGFCRVIGARHGKEAIEFMSEETPALIISDIIMPQMDGLELLTLIRSDPELGHIPFLILSARNQQRDINTGIAMGADDYIIKPFTPQGLIDTVSRVLGNR